MRVSIERLRWFLVAGAVLLIGGLTAIVFVGRYRAREIFKAKARAFLHSAHETRNFTYSDSLLGRTAYTMHAGRVVQHGDGTYSLYDVAVELHSKTSTEVDHIYANQIEYDQNTGVGKAIGEVRMELEVPQSVTSSRHGSQSPPTSRTAASQQVVYVETAGVVYVRRLGIAATDQPVHFRWGKMTCEAKGAEFTPSESTLRLLADVHAQGTMGRQPLDVTAAQATIDRNANVANFEGPSARSGERMGRADHGIAYLRKDGTVDHGSASGHVVLGQGTAQLSAAHLDAVMGDGAWLKSAKLTGGVTLVDTNPRRPMQGGSQTMDASFDADGTVKQVIGRGQASLAYQERSVGGRMLPRAMRGETITADFMHGAVRPHAGAAVLTGLHAVGAAQVRGESMSALAGSAGKPAVPQPGAAAAQEPKDNTVDADDLMAAFGTTADGHPLLKTLVGTGHTRLRQRGAQGDESESRAETLHAVFVPGPTGTAQLATATQAGHLTMMSRSAPKPAPKQAQGKAAEGQPTVSTGSAAEGTYEAATDTLTLTGGTHFSDGQNSLTAAAVTVHEGSGDAEARGNVLASIESQGQAGADGKAAGAQPVTHVASAEAKFVREGKLAEFRGTDAAPARLWQGGSQVQAADLLFDGVRRTLVARPAGPGGMVRSVFANQGGPGGAGPVPGARPAGAQARAAGERKTAATIVHVTSPKLDYSDATRQAVFAGGVRMEGTIGNVESQRAVVTLSPAKQAAASSSPAAQANPVNGSLEKAVVYGEVHLQQPGRTGTGDQLTYTAADEQYVLTGTPRHPPHIVDAQQGNVTGAILVFSDAGSTIVVSGTPGQPGGRVRTETGVRQSH